MAQIVFGGTPYWIPYDRMHETIERLEEGLGRGELVKLELRDREGDLSVLLITPGAPVVVSEWDPYDPAQDPAIQDLQRRYGQ